jgi:hypothetical protein
MVGVLLERSIRTRRAHEVHGFGLDPGKVARVAVFSHDLKRRDRLGGLIHEYSYAA